MVCRTPDEGRLGCGLTEAMPRFVRNLKSRSRIQIKIISPLSRIDSESHVFLLFCRDSEN